MLRIVRNQEEVDVDGRQKVKEFKQALVSEKVISLRRLGFCFTWVWRPRRDRGAKLLSDRVRERCVKTPAAWGRLDHFHTQNMQL